MFRVNIILCCLNISDGKKCGFGFVQFTSLRNAVKAVEVMNGTKILGTCTMY